MAEVLIGLGGNLEDRESCLAAALHSLGAEPGVQIIRVSSLYETEPVGGPPQGRYLNACVLVRTMLDPHELLSTMRQIEAAGGRVHRIDNGPRTIDLDLLLFEDRRLEIPSLQIPHPRMLERAFVLVPAVEVAPAMVHPLTGRTLEQHLSDLGRTRGVIRFRPEGWWRGSVTQVGAEP